MTAGHGRPVHIVVTCSNRKRHAVPADLRAGNLTQKRPAARFSAWTKRLQASESPRVRAADLYAGEHWQVARTLTETAGTPDAQLWVASAGYGLIKGDAPICAYAATFSSPAPDTVGASLDEVTDWWRRLGEWAGPDSGQPRTFTELASRNRGAIVIAVLSEAYQRACGEDLLAAAQILPTGSLSVIGPPDVRSSLAEILVPVTSPLRHTVGGSLQALNARVAKHLLSAGHGLDVEALRHRARAAHPAQLPTARPRGQRLSDVELAETIASRPHTSATRLLRELRTAGQSCEQHRFKRIHDEVCREHRS
jgi:hypothetical protein